MNITKKEILEVLNAAIRMTNEIDKEEFFLGPNEGWIRFTVRENNQYRLLLMDEATFYKSFPTCSSTCVYEDPMTVDTQNKDPV